MNIKETIKVKGNSGKEIELSYEELLKKKANPKLDIYNGKYIIRITRWYNYYKSFDNLSEATSTLVVLTQNFYKVSH